MHCLKLARAPYPAHAPRLHGLAAVYQPELKIPPVQIQLPGKPAAKHNTKQKSCDPLAHTAGRRYRTHRKKKRAECFFPQAQIIKESNYLFFSIFQILFGNDIPTLFFSFLCFSIPSEGICENKCRSLWHLSCNFFPASRILFIIESVFISSLSPFLQLNFCNIKKD